MKNQLHTALKQFLRCELLKTRNALNLFEESMAHLLIMSTRAYTDLEGGKTCCGLITFLLFFATLLSGSPRFCKQSLRALDSVGSDVA